MPGKSKLLDARPQNEKVSSSPTQLERILAPKQLSRKKCPTKNLIFKTTPSLSHFFGPCRKSVIVRHENMALLSHSLLITKDYEIRLPLVRPDG